MNECVVCKGFTVTKLLDLGKQHISHLFSTVYKNDEPSHNLTLGVCEQCGLAQLLDPFPVDALVPGYDWITYVEAEDHLDKLTKDIVSLPGINHQSKVCAISFKDDTLIDRLKAVGIDNCCRLSMEEDLNIYLKNAGIETLQDKFKNEIVTDLSNKYGRFDLVIARHILEHSYDTLDFLNQLKSLVTDDGYIVIEVPDTLKSFEKFDYSVIWEEHLAYFTPTTFINTIKIAGFKLISYECFDYPMENALVAVIQVNHDPLTVELDAAGIHKELQLLRTFSEQFEKTKTRLHQYFSDYKRQNHKKIALFGAGHMACAFINYFDIERYLDLVIDDNPNKIGLFMPGTGLQIYGSKALIDHEIDLCLLTLNPRHEEKVVQKNQAYVSRGGAFYSIFASSHYFFKILLEDA